MIMWPDADRLLAAMCLSVIVAFVMLWLILSGPRLF